MKIFSAVFTGMLYASQDFQKLAYVQVCCQLLIFLPVVLMVKSGIFGHIYLSTLLWIDVTVQFSQVAGMGIVVWQNMGQQLRQIIVIADYTPRWERTLGVTRGEKVMLLRDADEWLKVVRSDQSEGWIPRSYSTLDGQVSSKV